MELLVILGASFQDLYHCFATAVELYCRDCCGIVTFAVELYLCFTMGLLAVQLYRCKYCGIVTFAVELYLLLAMELLVIWSFLSRRYSFRVSHFHVNNRIFPSVSTW